MVTLWRFFTISVLVCAFFANDRESYLRASGEPASVEAVKASHSVHGQEHNGLEIESDRFQFPS
jgi:hypothetical protein